MSMMSMVAGRRATSKNMSATLPKLMGTAMLMLAQVCGLMRAVAPMRKAVVPVPRSLKRTTGQIGVGEEQEEVQSRSSGLSHGPSLE